MEKKEEMRKGPWTEQEDVQLALYVNLFGDRRWDFIAKVSGLKRTGKSCRLRWVNYLHPGLKRGKMTPHEERLVLELHSKWGNRWSRIARKLPGRTDNEIKNYWRTHMRKKSQDQRKKLQKPCISSSSSSSLSNSSSSSTISLHNSPCSPDHHRHHRINDHQVSGKNKTDGLEQIEESTAGAGASANSMDEIWKEFEFQEESCCRPPLITCEVVASPIWEYYCPTTTDYSLWCMDNIGEDIQETKTTTTTLGDHDHVHDYHSNFPFCNYMSD